MKVKSLITISTIMLFSNSSFAKEKSETKNIKSLIPIFSQKVSHSLPIDWQPVYENDDGKNYIIEFTPNGQNIENWKEMITVIGFKDGVDLFEPDYVIESITNNIKNVCPKGNLIFEPLGGFESNGIKGTQALIGCSNINGVGEISYHLVIKGSKDIYSIQKAKRFESFTIDNLPINKDNYQSFIESLLPIDLCKRNFGKPYECLK